MRKLLTLSAVSLLCLQAPLRADSTVDEPSDPALSDEAQVDADQPQANDDAERFIPQGQFRQWYCRAQPFNGFGNFTGSSNSFRAGSGEGQEAHRQAYRRALRQCERFSPACSSASAVA